MPFLPAARGARLPDPAQNAGSTTTGLTANGALDAASLAFGPNSTVGYKGSAVAGIPAISNGSPAANIALLGNYMASSLTTGGNGAWHHRYGRSHQHRAASAHRQHRGPSCVTPAAPPALRFILRKRLSLP